MVVVVAALLFSYLGCVISLQITTVGNKVCKSPFKVSPKGLEYRFCTSVDSCFPLVPRCATWINSYGVGEQFEDCFKMDFCPLNTIGNKRCRAFWYKGVEYPKGSCTYVDTLHPTLPWCSIRENLTDHELVKQKRDWDYCHPDCLMPEAPASTGPTEYDFSNPNVDWCDIKGSNCCPGSLGRQSPIDIPIQKAKFDPALRDDPLMFSAGYFASTKAKVVNDGITNTISFIDELPMEISGGPLRSDVYRLVQFHFHFGQSNSEGAEHLVNGKSYPLEIHLVHKNNKYDTLGEALTRSDGLAVIGIFFQVGQTSSFIESINVDIRNEGESVEVMSLRMIDLLSQVPDVGFYTTYLGSLTTPTCNEVVTWINILSPTTISQHQLEVFRGYLNAEGKTLAPNFRPVQPLNGRHVTKSKKSV